MAINNVFEFEELLFDKVSTLFSDGMVFLQVEASELDNQTFTSMPIEEEKVGCLILNRGHTTDPIVTKTTTPTQKIKQKWQIAIVAPKELYKIAGEKDIEVGRFLLGQRLSKEFTPLQRVNDERDFNEPEFINDLVYIPSMYEVGCII